MRTPGEVIITIMEKKKPGAILDKIDDFFEKARSKALSRTENQREIISQNIARFRVV